MLAVQQRLAYISSVRILNAVLNTSQVRWTIEIDGEIKKGNFVLLTWLDDTYIYIYIYIYIYCYPQTECFVVSQLFSVARHARCFKQGSKPAWLYATWISYRVVSVSEGIFTFTFTNILTTFAVVNSWEQLCIYAKWQPVIPRSSAQPLVKGGGHIYCHPQTEYFIVSQHFRVTRHARCFKLGSKPTWLYVSW